MIDVSGGKWVVAVDLGGTKVSAALINDHGDMPFRCQEPTYQSGPEDGIEQIARLIEALLGEAGLRAGQVCGIGVGIPAVLAPDDRVVWAPNLNGWRDVALGPALERRLSIPAFIEYDGHTAVLGEWWQGAGRGYQSIAMVIVGTGIGGGLILDGKLYRGRDRLAGAAGWFALTADARLSEPRGHALGHWESLAAGPGIASRARAALAAHPDSRLNGPDPLTARLIFEQARAGDRFAGEWVRETAAILGLGIANIVSLVNPEVVVLGGSVGQQGDLLLDAVREVVLNWAQPIAARSVVLTSSTLGPNAGLYGAGYAALVRTGQAGTVHSQPGRKGGANDSP